MTGLKRVFRVLVVLMFLGTAYQTYANLVEEYKNGLIWEEPKVVETAPHQPRRSASYSKFSWHRSK